MPMLHHCWFALLYGVMSVCEPVMGAPNIVMITVEDLGWSDVSWNNPEVIMPNIATLASSGVILDSAYVQPTSGSSQASLLTGKYPSRTGQQFIDPTNLEPLGLPLDVTILPQYLSKLGFKNHLLGRWSQGFCSSKYLPTNRGFSSFYGNWASGSDHYNHIASADPRSPLTTLGFDFHDDENSIFGNIRYNKVDLMVDRFTEKLNEHLNIQQGLFGFGGYPTGKVQYTRNESNPFFFLLNFDTLKLPLNPEDKFREMYPYQDSDTRKDYLAAISQIDDAIGNIMADLRRFYSIDENKTEKTLFKDTIIIFSSTSAGHSSKTGPVYSGSSSNPLRGQQGDLLEGGCRVPAFIANIGASGHDKSLFHISDWLPTIYSGLAGGNQNDIFDLDGVNQIDVIRGVSEPLRTEVLYDIVNFNVTNFGYTHVTSPDWPDNIVLTGSFGASLRKGSYKLALGCNTLLGCSRNYNTTWDGNTDNDRVVLYNLDEDPEEAEDLSEDEDYADIIEDLTKRLSWHLDRAVTPLHADFENAGLPLYSFPPGQFHTSWCDDTKYDSFKNVTQSTV